MLYSNRKPRHHHRRLWSHLLHCQSLHHPQTPPPQQQPPAASSTCAPFAHVSAHRHAAHHVCEVGQTGWAQTVRRHLHCRCRRRDSNGELLAAHHCHCCCCCCYDCCCCCCLSYQCRPYLASAGPCQGFLLLLLLALLPTLLGQPCRLLASCAATSLEATSMIQDAQCTPAPTQ